MGNGGQSCFKWSGKALQLRLLHNVTCQDLGAEYFRSEHCRGKQLQGLGKLKEQKKSQCRWRPVKGGYGNRREGRQVQISQGYVSNGDGSGIDWEVVESHWRGLRRRSHFHLHL